MPEKPLAVGRGKPVSSVYTQVHSFYLLRHRIRHTPSGQRQIGISPVTDILHPVLLRKPVDCTQSVLTLVNVRLPHAFRLPCPPAALNNIDKSSSGQFRAVYPVRIHRMEVRTPLQDYRPHPVFPVKVILFHMENIGFQAHTVRHRQHHLLDCYFPFRHRYAQGFVILPGAPEQLFKHILCHAPNSFRFSRCCCRYCHTSGSTSLFTAFNCS